MQNKEGAAKRPVGKKKPPRQAGGTIEARSKEQEPGPCSGQTPTDTNLRQKLAHVKRRSGQRPRTSRMPLTLLIPSSVRLLFAPDGAGLSVSPGCGELLAADLADLLAGFSGFAPKVTSEPKGAFLNQKSLTLYNATTVTLPADYSAGLHLLTQEYRAALEALYSENLPSDVRQHRVHQLQVEFGQRRAQELKAIRMQREDDTSLR